MLGRLLAEVVGELLAVGGADVVGRRAVEELRADGQLALVLGEAGERAAVPAACGCGIRLASAPGDVLGRDAGEEEQVAGVRRGTHGESFRLTAVRASIGRRGMCGTV